MIKPGSSYGARVYELERELRKLTLALRRERERAEAEAKRADALAESSRAAWRVVAYGRRAETP